MPNNLPDAWTYYRDGDPGVVLFETCLAQWSLTRPGRMNLPPNARVLELGCLETGWAAALKLARPDVTVYGLDVRDSSHEGPAWGGDHFIQGDAADPLTYVGDSAPMVRFDAVVSLSAIEHFGLAYPHYGDPANPHADVQAVSLAWAQLRVGGWMYYDVPWHPTHPHTTPHYRCYADCLKPSLLPHVPVGLTPVWQGWVVPQQEATILPGRPGDPPPNGHPFYYVANLLEKA